MSRHILLSKSRDIPLLEFLWKWKLSTTAALAHKFFPNCSRKTAYRRLQKLSHAGVIQTKLINQRAQYVWTLDQKGYWAIAHKLPELRCDGFQSENLEHDLLATAIHLGDWLFGVPEKCSLFSEQQLRRFYPEHYLGWVPKPLCTNEEEIHRPDGYWQVSQNDVKKTIALEVELSPKRDSDYEAVGQFYSDPDNKIYRVLWVVPRLSLAKRLGNMFASNGSKSQSSHNFVLLNKVTKLGWQAPIELGPESGITISKLLNPSKGKSWGSFPIGLLLDTRKSFAKSYVYENQPPIDFCDRLGSQPIPSYVSSDHLSKPSLPQSLLSQSYSNQTFPFKSGVKS